MFKDVVGYIMENYEFTATADDVMLLFGINVFVICCLTMLFIFYKRKKKRVFIDVSDMNYFEMQIIVQMIDDIRKQRHIDEPEKGYI